MYISTTRVVPIPLLFMVCIVSKSSFSFCTRHYISISRFCCLYGIEVGFLVLYASRIDYISKPYWFHFTFNGVCIVFKTIFFVLHPITYVSIIANRIDFTFILSLFCLCRIISKSVYLVLYPITMWNVSATDFSLTICLRRDQGGRRGLNISTDTDHRTRTIDFRFSTVLVRYPITMRNVPAAGSPLVSPTKHPNQNLPSLSPLFSFLHSHMGWWVGVSVFAG